MPAVDRAARARYAELLRRFVGGRITNREYERGYVEIRTNDPAIDAIYEAVWESYCDIRTHRLDGDWRPAGEHRRGLVECILFLHSDRPYVPEPLGWLQATIWLLLSPAPYALVMTLWILDVLLEVATLGLWKRYFAQWCESEREPPYWPFATQDKLDDARAQPRLLRGAA